MTIYTISRQDVYDFGRCPKIVSIKSFKSSHPQEKKPAARRAEPVIPTSVVGKLGEMAVAAAFSSQTTSAAPSKVVESVVRETSSKLSDIGIVIDGEIKRLLDETANGLALVRASLVDEYGEIRVVGRGGCKNGIFPGEALPDLVATSPNLHHPILIEVKNSSIPAATDRFQAGFYNTVARETGVIVHEQRIESGRLVLNPVAYHESITDTLLVYPRLGSYEKVSDHVDMSEIKIRQIWTAKQLGLLGRSPHTDCDSKCPHYRLKIELPEGNIETATPLALTYAASAKEAGMDFDTHYLRNFFFKSGLAYGLFDWVFRARHSHDNQAKRQAIDLLASKTGMTRETVERMAFTIHTIPNAKKILRGMAANIEQWEKMIGEKSVKDQSFLSKTQSIATRIYALPDRSEDFIESSRKRWNA
jgi:hypothetical protein